jgi:hypothetical protein
MNSIVEYFSRRYQVISIQIASKNKAKIYNQICLENLKLLRLKLNNITKNIVIIVVKNVIILVSADVHINKKNHISITNSLSRLL